MIDMMLHQCIAILVSGLVFSGCALVPRPDPNPRAREFDPSNDHDSLHTLHFKVGDQFVTRKPMFVVKSVAGVIEVNLAGRFSPTLEEYRADPEYWHTNLFRSGPKVIKYLPVGTELTIVSIKASKMAGFIVYFSLDSYEGWVRCSKFRDHWSEDDFHEYGYDRELFSWIRGG